MHLIRWLNALDTRVLGPPHTRRRKVSAGISAILWAVVAVVGIVVALLGNPRYGWSLAGLSVLLGAFHALRYLSLSDPDDE